MRRPKFSVPTLFEDGCPDESHSWTAREPVETSEGVLTAQTCGVCGLVWVKLSHPGGELGLRSFQADKDGER